MKIESIPQQFQPQILQNEQKRVSNPQVKDPENTAVSPGQPAAESTEQVSLNITIPRRTLDTLERIGGITDILNSTAKKIRETDQNLELSSSIIEKMKAELSKITKNFPPFDLASQERKAILMSYEALKKQIEQMTVPAPPPQIYEKVAHIWQDIFTNQDGTIPTPTLPATASDTTVQSALGSLAVTGERISEIRQELGTSFA